MAAYGLDVECPHIFDGTQFAQWRNWMTCNFKYISPQMWWMIDVGFSQVLDEENLTQAQEKCLHLDYQATNIFYSSMKDNIFGEIMDIKSSHEIWSYLNEKYGAITKEDDVPKVDAREDVEHDHNMVVEEDCSTSWLSEDEDDGYESDASTSSSTSSHSSMSHGDGKHLLYVTTCSHEELKLVHEELYVTHDNLVKDHAFLTKKISNEEIKTSESSSLGSNDQSHIITNPCDVGKKHVSTSCHDLLSMPCSSDIDACSTSMSCETNLLMENNKLNEQVKYLSNKLERCYNSKVTFEHILKTQRIYGDKCGLGFKEKMTKGKRKQEKGQLSNFMCYRCHEVGHLANGCPNKEKLKKIKEKERIKHVKCFKCRTWGHLTSMCPTKQLVKQQVKPQPKPQVEQEKKPKAQVKFNYHGDLMKKKKKTRRGERARHPMQIQDAKMMSKNQDKKKAYAHIMCFECKNEGHFASRCTTKLEKMAQATLKKQGNEKQHMSKEEKAQSKRSNSSKPISIDNHNMLRKDGDGTSMVAIAKHPAIHTKALPKYVAPNLRGPKLVWVPSKGG
ncbi:hypothetical protein BDA96_08G102100 [Sorghum bicolor]|uniref:CCHC-type domain-containing protein n=1 Tax=Sorghum bicolor TaxID=4558 RepID=A0A921QFG7_SORBI|nr:hypothetical protein BDA96_08G102100 [Sorghum bicolor]